MNCIFCDIRDRKIPKEFSFEDESIMVFPDIHPNKPIHLLVVPKKHMQDFSKLQDDVLLAKIKTIIQKMIEEKGLSEKGYQLVVNGGGLQKIDHLHFHIKGPYM